MTEIKKGRFDKFTEVMEPFNLPADFVAWLQSSGFFIQAASHKYHGACEGGLFDHSYAVAETLVDFTNKMQLKWGNPRSPWLIGMLHDVCKMDAYQMKVVDGNAHYELSKNSLYPGHGSKSVMILSQWFRLTEEEALCIAHHMGAFETDAWNSYRNAIEKYPNVLWTHTADMLTATVKGL